MYILNTTETNVAASADNCLSKNVTLMDNTTIFSYTRRLTAIIACLMILPAAEAGLHKWVDEHGQTHYGDRIPPKYMKKEHSTLNEQGVQLRTNKAMKTEEQLQEEEEQRKLKIANDRKLLIEQRKQALRDRVLLDTFTTEKDLAIVRDERIEAIDSQISLAQTLIKNDERKLADVKQRIKEIEASGREAPENLHKEVLTVSRQLENNYAFIEDKNNERTNILETFEEDVKRFRELMKAKHERQTQQ